MLWLLWTTGLWVRNLTAHWFTLLEEVIIECQKIWNRLNLKYAAYLPTLLDFPGCLILTARLDLFICRFSFAQKSIGETNWAGKFADPQFQTGTGYFCGACVECCFTGGKSVLMLAGKVSWCWHQQTLIPTPKQEKKLEDAAVVFVKEQFFSLHWWDLPGTTSHAL